tara:strand:- start:30 stop:557 length:528 start_codon:yes stop_codon:yes gene_type:complete
MKLQWKVMNPRTGEALEEDAPLTSVASGGVDLSPDAAIKKKKKKNGLYDGRTKAYKEHRKKLEAARLRRQEALKNKQSSFKEHVIGFTLGEKYDIYHKDYSSAMQHSYAQVKKQGYEVDPKEIDDKVASGPRKPSSGKTNKFILGLMKNGKPVKQNLHVQVYNTGKSYELNMYVD